MTGQETAVALLYVTKFVRPTPSGNIHSNLREELPQLDCSPYESTKIDVFNCLYAKYPLTVTRMSCICLGFNSDFLTGI